MKILVNSKITRDTIGGSLGRPEYSYYFLLKEFLPALEQVGDVIVVGSLQEARQRYRQLMRKSTDVVMISVSPPHQTPLSLRCPTVTLFAWEFDTLPDTGWDDNPGNDWRHVFANTAGAICTSSEAADLVRQAAPDSFPVIALPAPVWDRYGHLRETRDAYPLLGERYFGFTGSLIDSTILGLSADGLVPATASAPSPSDASSAEAQLGAEPSTGTTPQQAGYWQWLLRLLRRREEAPEPPPPPPGVIVVEQPFSLQVTGVVYTTLLNPGDSRKNWVDIITAFCWAFRERPDATLILKMTHHDLEYYRVVLVTLLSRLSPFACRVVALHGFMEDGQYAELINATTYYVNASSGEGLCLPLTEFLSAGIPAIAPTHTAMADYVDSSVAFTVRCSLEPFTWPHDPSGIFTTHRHRLNWQSLMEAFQASYATATERSSEYQAMSEAASARMQDYASVAVVRDQLAGFLQRVAATNSSVLRRWLG